MSLPHKPPSRQCLIRLRETSATPIFGVAGIHGNPYQYQDYKRGVPVLTGFDIEIERALARIMNVEIALPQMAWENHLAALAAGDADIAAGATESEARSRYAYFSKPYRTETDVLILPRGTSGRYPFRTIEEMLDTFTKQKFRLGIVAGFVYADQRVNAFIADPANRDRIFAVESEVQNLRNLQDGIIDGFIADRIVATTAAWRRNAGSLIEEHPLRFSTDIHFMLSRATQTPQMLARLDQAIDELKRSGEFRRIADSYALPVLINQTLDSDWFRVLAFVGTVAFALSGVVLAYQGNYTLFGATDPRDAAGGRRRRRARSDLAARATRYCPQSRGALDRVRNGPCWHGGDQDNIARTGRHVRQIPARACGSGNEIDRIVRCDRACRVHRCGRRGRARHRLRSRSGYGGRSRR